MIKEALSLLQVVGDRILASIHSQHRGAKNLGSSKDNSRGGAVQSEEVGFRRMCLRQSGRNLARAPRAQDGSRKSLAKARRTFGTSEEAIWLWVKTNGTILG